MYSQLRLYFLNAVNFHIIGSFLNPLHKIVYTGTGFEYWALHHGRINGIDSFSKIWCLHKAKSADMQS